MTKKTFSTKELPEEMQESMDKVSELIDARIAGIDGDGIAVIEEALALYVELMSKTLVDPELLKSYRKYMLPEAAKELSDNGQDLLSAIRISARLKDAGKLLAMFKEIANVLQEDEQRACGGLN